MAAKAALIGDYLTIGVGIVYVGVFTLVVLYLVARMFTVEKIVTAKFARRRLRLSEQST